MFVLAAKSLSMVAIAVKLSIGERSVRPILSDVVRQRSSWPKSYRLA
jgi:hypothetical protein